MIGLVLKTHSSIAMEYIMHENATLYLKKLHFHTRRQLLLVETACYSNKTVWGLGEQPAKVQCSNTLITSVLAQPKSMHMQINGYQCWDHNVSILEASIHSFLCKKLYVSILNYDVGNDVVWQKKNVFSIVMLSRGGPHMCLKLTCVTYTALKVEQKGKSWSKLEIQFVFQSSFLKMERRWKAEKCIN